jgi:hypothetical protein
LTRHLDAELLKELKFLNVDVVARRQRGHFRLPKSDLCAADVERRARTDRRPGPGELELCPRRRDKRVLNRRPRLGLEHGEVLLRDSRAQLLGRPGNVGFDGLPTGASRAAVEKRRTVDVVAQSEVVAGRDIRRVRAEL